VKIAIVGCGAMGSVYAGLFAAAGNEVCAWRAPRATAP
jgi:ketopantoate reductase